MGFVMPKITSQAYPKKATAPQTLVILPWKISNNRVGKGKDFFFLSERIFALTRTRPPLMIDLVKARKKRKK